NPKQTQKKINLKLGKSKTPNPKEACLELYLFWSFEIVSNFGFRASNFLFSASLRVSPLFRFRKPIVNREVQWVWLVLRGNELPTLERRLVVVGVLLGSLGELHLLALYFLVGDQAEQVTDAVEARATLVVRGDDVPGSPFRVRRLKHHVARPRVLEPSTPRAHVRRARLPLAHRR